jgi:hypothetical protein
MQCKLSEQDLELLMPLFDNHGYVDGCEFILLFYRLRYDFRSKLLSIRIKKDKTAIEAAKYAVEKKLEESEEKVRISLAEHFEKSDLESAMEKIVNAAVKYDRTHPGAVQLDAFDCESMPPHIFKEQLKMTFNVQLSIPELTAFVRNFNKDTPDEDNVNCSAFLVTFFRMGFKEKNRRLHEKWATKKRIAEEKEARRREELKMQESRNNLKASMDFTPEDKDSAILKLKGAAKLYDKTHPGAMSMKSFEVKSMPPHVFKEQLKRVFNLNVTPAELGALMYVFDCKYGSIVVYHVVLWCDMIALCYWYLLGSFCMALRCIMTLRSV